MDRLLPAMFAVLFALAGCGDDGKGAASGGSPVGLPQLPAITVRVNGGDALIGPGTSGGHAGRAVFQASHDILLDDGRSRPSVTVNFLAPLLGDGEITWPQLAAMSPPSISNGVATFGILASYGMHLPAGATLDLSEVPFGVDTVEFLTNTNFIVEGNVILTRPTADAVNLRLTTSSTFAAAIYVNGQFDGRGSLARNGATIALNATGWGSGIIFHGSADVSGGQGHAAADGGNAGNFFVNSSGDLILRNFGVEGRGGSGTAAGGDGGELHLWATNEFRPVARWGGDLRGGAGGTGNGGRGGEMALLCHAASWSYDGPALAVHSRAIVAGGDSVDGDGGAGGSALAGSLEHQSGLSGTLYVQGGGGHSVNGTGGAGSTHPVTAMAGTIENFRMVCHAQGGDGLGGGTGGEAALLGNVISNAVLEALLDGGAGATLGGNGGSAYIQGSAPTSDAAWTGVRLAGSANGGAGATGGDGGFAEYGPSATAMATLAGIRIDFTAHGGQGDNGGSGGSFLMTGGAIGSCQGEWSFQANGGESTAVGGTGGSAEVQGQGATLNLHVNLILNGAEAGGTGGDVLMATDGGISISGAIAANGGAAPASGGNGGSIEIGNDQAWQITLSNGTTLQANGAATGGVAGTINLDAIGSPGNVTVGAATLETNDGNGTDQSATNVTID